VKTLVICTICWSQDYIPTCVIVALCTADVPGSLPTVGAPYKTAELEHTQPQNSAVNSEIITLFGAFYGTTDIFSKCMNKTARQWSHQTPWAANSASNSTSSTTGTPNCWASANLLPAPGPATTHDVFFETLPDTFAPSSCRRDFASSRDIASSVPVSTYVWPASGCSSRARALIAGQVTAAACSRRMTSILRGTAKKSTICCATIGPTSGTRCSFSTSAAIRVSRSPK